MAVPAPEPGLVVSYAFLWLSEYKSGIEEGRKDRPSVIILKVRTGPDTTRVVVVPITHSRPIDAECAIEIPASVKKSIGLDALRSWVVISEANEFAWPGYDLRQVRAIGSATDSCHPASFVKLSRAFLLSAKAERRH